MHDQHLERQWETLARALCKCPKHYRPIIRAVRDYGCGYAQLLQDAGPFTLPLTHSTAIVLGDNLYTSKGLAAFDAHPLQD